MGKTVTDKQLAANRANARKSTGPKTPAGKYNSSRNAITHGFLAQSVLLPGESQVRFLHLLRTYIAEFEPCDRYEMDLVETMTVAQWRKMRGWILATAAMDRQQRLQDERGMGQDEDPPTQFAMAHQALSGPPRSQEDLSRWEVRFDRVYHRAADRLFRRKAEREAKESSHEHEKLPQGTHQVTESKDNSHFPTPIRSIDEASTNPDRTADEPASEPAPNPEFARPNACNNDTVRIKFERPLEPLPLGMNTVADSPNQREFNV